MGASLTSGAAADSLLDDVPKAAQHGEAPCPGPTPSRALEGFAVERVELPSVPAAEVSRQEQRRRSVENEDEPAQDEAAPASRRSRAMVTSPSSRSTSAFRRLTPPGVMR